MTLKRPPVPGWAAGMRAWRALWRNRNLLAPLAALHAQLGDVFQLPIPNFNPIVLAGPEAARFVMVESTDDLRWRAPTDPVTRLLRHGLLVEDGASHDSLRALMTPALHRRMIDRQIAVMQASADEVAGTWRDGSPIDVLAEMRRIAILILTRALYSVDAAPALTTIWQPLLRTLAYIAPGAWLLWPAIPRPGYARALRQMDEYLLRLISARRAAGAEGDDLLSLLIRAGLPDPLIRDQLLTMLIAGHDTATASLAWTFYALGRHPRHLELVKAELDAELAGREADVGSLGKLHQLERVIKETLRLWPPIHVGNRIAARDLTFAGRRIPAGARVLFSIFVTHRHPTHWPDPNAFIPERFDPSLQPPPGPFTYVPFGGGPRYCIGAVMAQVELKVVLARLLQQFDFERLPGRVGMRMGATLEPEALWMRPRRRDTVRQAGSRAR